MTEIKNFLNLLINLRNLESNKTQTEMIIPNEELQGSIPTSQPIPGEESSSFLWLLIIDLLIFIGLSFRAYQSALKIEENIQDTEDPNVMNKLKFMKGLTYSNGSKNKTNLNSF